MVHDTVARESPVTVNNEKDLSFQILRNESLTKLNIISKGVITVGMSITIMPIS